MKQCFEAAALDINAQKVDLSEGKTMEISAMIQKWISVFEK